jgi:hypothetical protein
MGIKVIGGTTGATQEVESNTLAARITLRPIDNGALGTYQKGLASGTMAAGLAGGSPIYSFRNSTTNVYTVKRVWISMGSLSTAFASGQATFNLFAARNFTASDSGGTAATLTGNNNKLRTSFATMGAADIRIASTSTLTAGSRTLDTDAISAISFAVSAASNTSQLAPNTLMWDVKPGEWPIVLAQNEGFVVTTTVPATGTWVFSVTTKWDELASF